MGEAVVTLFRASEEKLPGAASHRRGEAHVAAPPKLNEELADDITARVRVERIRCFEAVAHRVGHQARQRAYRTRARGILDSGSGAYARGGGRLELLPVPDRAPEFPTYPLAYFLKKGGGAW
jgi:hypothetical protein